MSRGEIRVKKVKIKTQNEKTVETDMDKHMKNSYLSQEETVQCKKPYELSVICFKRTKIC